jgi:LmbE family N-acetylglucosaminyl deacetylase
LAAVDQLPELNVMPQPISLFIPDNANAAEAQARTSHLGIGAHQSDLESMAFHGIATCYQQEGAWFSGVTCTDGVGSARTLANKTDQELRTIRAEEQRRAAELGQYSYMAQLGLASATIKNPNSRGTLLDQLEQYLLLSQPEVLYTHNPADKHASHVAVFHAVIEALLRVPPYSRPKKVYGCELWRDLDWLEPEDKIALDVSAYPELAQELNDCFASQIAGGKDYEQAVRGRRCANATFYDSHTVDSVNQLWFAMDLTPLIEEDAPELKDFVQAKLERFQISVLDVL